MSFAAGIGKSLATKDMQSILEEVDTSKDGKVSLEEHLADIHNQVDGGDEEETKELEERKQVETDKFHAADVDRNGLLDSDELPGLYFPEIHDGVLDVTVRQSMKQKDTNGDGKLDAKEFWEAEAKGDDGELSEEENQDFAKLDLNGDGHIDLAELRSWESGHFHTEDAMRKLFELADADHDMHVTAEELSRAREQISLSDAQYHLIEWAEHHEL